MNHPAASGRGINTDLNFTFAASGGELNPLRLKQRLKIEGACYRGKIESTFYLR